MPWISASLSALLIPNLKTSKRDGKLFLRVAMKANLLLLAIGV
jgi:hypothetical protein